jgi:hypothetical protein
MKQTTPRIFHGEQWSLSGRVGSEHVAGKGKARQGHNATPEHKLEMVGMHLRRTPATPHRNKRGKA